MAKWALVMSCERVPISLTKAGMRSLKRVELPQKRPDWVIRGSAREREKKEWINEEKSHVV